MVIGKPLFTTEQIKRRVKELALKITDDYRNEEFLAVGILKGAFMFFADIVRNINTPLEIDFIMASSYAKTESTGKVKIHADLREDIRGRNILLIEDIVDTGLTLKYIQEMLLSRAPSSLRTCVLLDKRPRRKVDVKLDYVGFEIPDEYVVGYGLDYENKFRNLPYIAVFKKSI